MAYGAILGQLVDAFTKGQTFSPETAALFGLGPDSVPDDVLELLSKAALYKTIVPTAQLGTLPEGSIIYLNENGSPVPFYVAKQNYEPAYNTNRVLIVRKGSKQNGYFNIAGVNTYNGSTIDNWMNGEYFQSLDQEVRSAIGTTNIPATSPYNSGVIRLNKAVFPLSGTEIGIPSRSYMNVEGSELPIASMIQEEAKSAYLGRVLTRSPLNDRNNQIFYYQNNASQYNGGVSANQSYNIGYLPSFTLPQDFAANTAPTLVTGLYDVSNNLLLKLPGVQIATGSYVGTGKYGSSNPNSLTLEFQPLIVIIHGQTKSANNPSYDYGYTIMVRPATRYETIVTYAALGYSGTIIWGNNEVSWFAEGNPGCQFNLSGEQYEYVVIG